MSRHLRTVSWWTLWALIIGLPLVTHAQEAPGALTIIVKNHTITQVLPGFQTPEDSSMLIDLSDYTVMPGLMDMHTHLSYQHGGPSTYMKRVQYNEADYAFDAAHYAQKTLMAGFTTVRNLGDSFNETVALRNAINRGVAVGPRIFTTAKSIATTGGHADPTKEEIVRATMAGVRRTYGSAQRQARPILRDELFAMLDRLVVMEEGRIIEQGSHDALLAKNGVYAQLWKRQSGGFLNVDADWTVAAK